ncbi:MAG TPA: hypothetical protein VI819_04460 [Patescibacteria group bacterium]|nr:hypothetical protein [Patescibacteria group bacterium]
MSDLSWRERYIRSKSLVRRTIVEYNKRPELKAYLEILLTLTAISLFGVFAIRPTLKTIGILIREIDEKEKVLETMKTKINNLSTAQKLFSEEENKIKLVYEAIPEGPSPEKLLLQIEELAYLDQVKISTLSMSDVSLLGEEEKPDSKSEEETVKTTDIITFTMGAEGDYEKLIKLTKDIEDLRRPIKFESISIDAVPDIDRTKLILSLSNLQSPYRKPENKNIK